MYLSLKKAMPKLSVIVPVYNVENYLPACLDSILCQTYSDFEIILINDGSTDTSGKICKDYAACDPRIRLIQQLNGGLSAARNIGLDHAKGDLIAFIDSDDTIQCDMFEIMATSILKNNADMAVCQFEMYGKKNISSKYMILRSSEKILEKLLASDKYGFFMWNKIFRREVIMNTRFLSGKLYEDISFYAEIALKIKCAIFIESTLYHYTQRDDSIVGSIFSPRKMDLIEANKQLRFLCQKEFKNLIFWVDTRLLLAGYGLLNRILLQDSISLYAKEYNEILKLIKRYQKNILNIPQRKRIFIYFLLYYPMLYKLMIKIYRFIIYTKKIFFK